MLKLFPEQEANDRAFVALARFLDLLDEVEARDGRPALDPLVLAFQLKLLWLAGYLPHLTSCAECGAEARARRLLAPGRRRRLRELPRGRDPALRGRAARDRGAAPRSARRRRNRRVGARAARDALAVIASSYEFHGGFRLRTLSA